MLSISYFHITTRLTPGARRDEWCRIHGSCWHKSCLKNCRQTGSFSLKFPKSEGASPINSRFSSSPPASNHMSCRKMAADYFPGIFARQIRAFRSLSDRRARMVSICGPLFLEVELPLELVGRSSTSFFSTCSGWMRFCASSSVNFIFNIK